MANGLQALRTTANRLEVCQLWHLRGNCDADLLVPAPPLARIYSFSSIILFLNSLYFERAGVENLKRLLRS